MKNFGCIVPVSFIILLGLLLSGCVGGFGTFTDKTPPAQYIKTHHHLPIKAPVQASEWPTDGCAGACTPAPTSTPTTPEVAPPVKPKKQGFWWRMRQHFPFKHKTAE